MASSSSPVSASPVAPSRSGATKRIRQQGDEAWHAEMLAAIAAVHNEVQACRAEVLAAIAAVNNEVQACRAEVLAAIADVRRVL